MGKEKRGIEDHLFWKRRYTTVFDVMICKTDSMTYQVAPSQTIVGINDKDRKDKYLEVPFVTGGTSPL